MKKQIVDIVNELKLGLLTAEQAQEQLLKVFFEDKMECVINEVREERQLQNAKWGEQNHNVCEWVSILAEEVGEVSKEAVDLHFKYGITDKQTEQNRIENYRKECIQVAAVAIQMVESLDRQLEK